MCRLRSIYCTPTFSETAYKEPLFNSMAGLFYRARISCRSDQTNQSPGKKTIVLFFAKKERILLLWLLPGRFLVILAVFSAIKIIWAWKAPLFIFLFCGGVTTDYLLYSMRRTFLTAICLLLAPFIINCIAFFLLFHSPNGFVSGPNLWR